MHSWLKQSYKCLSGSGKRHKCKMIRGAEARGPLGPGPESGSGSWKSGFPEEKGQKVLHMRQN